MDRIKALYDILKSGTPGKMLSAIRKNDLSGCLVESLNVLSSETQREVLAYGRDIEAAKMVPPYLLSDFLCYIYADDAAFRLEHGVTDEYIDQAIYDGCLWHNGAIYRPEQPGDTSVDGFLNARIDFKDKYAKCLRSALWPEYVMWTSATGNRMLDRMPFLREAEKLLAIRGHKVRRSVRVGTNVSTGYLGISVKTV